MLVVPEDLLCCPCTDQYHRCLQDNDIVTPLSRSTSAVPRPARIVRTAATPRIAKEPAQTFCSAHEVYAHLDKQCAPLLHACILELAALYINSCPVISGHVCLCTWMMLLIVNHHAACLWCKHDAARHVQDECSTILHVQPYHTHANCNMQVASIGDGLGSADWQFIVRSCWQVLGPASWGSHS